MVTGQESSLFSGEWIGEEIWEIHFPFSTSYYRIKKFLKFEKSPIHFLYDSIWLNHYLFYFILLYLSPYYVILYYVISYYLYHYCFQRSSLPTTLDLRFWAKYLRFLFISNQTKQNKTKPNQIYKLAVH